MISLSYSSGLLVPRRRCWLPYFHLVKWGHLPRQWSSRHAVLKSCWYLDLHFLLDSVRREEGGRGGGGVLVRVVLRRRKSLFCFETTNRWKIYKLFKVFADDSLFLNLKKKMRIRSKKWGRKATLMTHFYVGYHQSEEKKSLEEEGQNRER